MKKSTFIVSICVLLVQGSRADRMKQEEDGGEVREHRSGKSSEPFVHIKAENPETVMTGHRAQLTTPTDHCQAEADEAFEREKMHTKSKEMHKAAVRENKEVLRNYSARPNHKSLEQRKEEILSSREALSPHNETREEVLKKAAEVQQASTAYTPEAVALKLSIVKHKKAAYKDSSDAREAAGQKHRAVKKGKLQSCPEVEKAKRPEPVKHKAEKKPVEKKRVVKRGEKNQCSEPVEHKAEKKRIVKRGPKKTVENKLVEKRGEKAKKFEAEKHEGKVEKKRVGKNPVVKRGEKNDHKKYARPVGKTRDDKAKEKADHKVEKKVKKSEKKAERLDRADNNEATKKRRRNVKSSNNFSKTPEHKVEEKQVHRKRLFSEDVDMEELIPHNKKAQ